MADMNALLDAVRDAVSEKTELAAIEDETPGASAPINAWCNLTYGRGQKVFIGIDGKNPPASDDYPVISVHPSEKEAGPAVDPMTHVIEIETGIEDENLATGGGENVVEYAGVKRNETFRKLVETAALKAIEAEGLRPASLKVTYLSIEVFPLFLASTEITAVQDGEMGEDAFE